MGFATRTTAWVRGGSGIWRRVRWVAGYDHGAHGGKHGDELSLDVRRGDVAVTLSLFTSVRNGVEHPFGDERSIRPAYLHTHLGFVWLAEQVRTAEAPSDCDVLEQGKCWSPEGSTHAADQIWSAEPTILEIERKVASPNIESLILDGVPAVWAQLELCMSDVRTVRWAQHAALPRQCEKCHGAGVVPRLS